MDDAAVVGRLECLGNLSGDGERLVQRQGLFAEHCPPACAHPPARERSRSGLLPLRLRSDFESVDLRDVGVIERCEQLRFTAEADDATGVAGERVGQGIFSATSRLSV